MDCVTAGNLMVQLFLQTQPKYHLNNKKLQYLLCIAQMLSLSSGRPLFEESIRNLKNDFALEPIADTFVYNKPIQEGQETNRPIDLTYDDFVLPYSGKRIYEVKESVSDEGKRVLIDTFVRFGAYQEETLRKELNQLTPLRQLPVWTYFSSDTITQFLDSALTDTGQYPNSRVVSLCEEIRLSSMTSEQTETETEDEPINEIPTNQVTDVPNEPKEAALPLPSVSKNILKKCSCYHLNQLVANKIYSLYIETADAAVVPIVHVVSAKDNSLVPGTLSRVTDTIYRYSFIGIASDIKILAQL